MNYKTNGTCAKLLQVDVDDGIIQDVKFVGGCQGGLRGIATLVKGMRVEEAIDKLKGIQCGTRGTSCPDQLANALMQTLQKEGKQYGEEV